MRPTMIRRCLVAGTLSAALAFVVACSGPSASGSLIPTAPSAAAAASSNATFSPFPTTDPCAPTASTADFTPNPDPGPTGCGRFTGGGFQVADVKVTRGFTLHCDALLSNNFEVNWPDGNNFHIDKNPTDVACTFVNDPNPPDAPVNRIDKRARAPSTANLPQ